MIEKIGISVDDKAQDALRARFCELLKRQFRHGAQIGAQPESLGKQHILKERPVLVGSDYLATEKSDGIRYLMLVDQGHVYLLDRKNVFTEVRVSFPVAEDPNRQHSGTILDGELVELKKNDNSQLCYLIFDLLTLDSVSRVEDVLLDRLAAARNVIMKGRSWMMKDDQLRNEAFSVTLKDFFPIQYVSWMFSTYIPQLNSENDGIIFTPRGEYALDNRTRLPDDSIRLPILKWKPAHLNTCDFQIQMETLPNSKEDKTRTSKWRLFCAIKGKLQALSNMLHFRDVVSPNWSEAENGKIAECYYNKDMKVQEYSPGAKFWSDCTTFREGCWTFLRFREDKKLPNDVETVVSVIRTIRDGIDEGNISEYCLSASKK